MRLTLVRPAIFAAITALSAACTNTQFVQRSTFNAPVDSVAGFLGYVSTTQKKTACGNCHVGTQAAWAQSAHARAISDLKAAVANPPSSCYACHTVNNNGNKLGPAATPAGYLAKSDTAYHDVQCESCHGPGLQHVQAPDDKSKWPLARAGVLTKSGANDSLTSCAACHNGTHHPFVEQWKKSIHGKKFVYINDSTRAQGVGINNCFNCHEGKTAMLRLIGNQATAFVEKDTVAWGAGGFQTAVCATCHDPHGSIYPKQLRLSINAADVTSNLCIACHNRSATPASNYSNGSRGAHGSQGAIVIGDNAGWIPNGFIYDTTRAVLTAHNSPRGLCATCHVPNYTITDPTSGAFVFQSVGHLFIPAPCLDAKGLPDSTSTCPYDATSRNWTGCTGAGCHASAAIAANAFNGINATVSTLRNTLWIDKNGNKRVDAFPTDDGLLSKVAQTEFSASNGLTVAEGALFNVKMLGTKAIDDHPDGSFGVHNPPYYTALLSASIQAVKTQYGLSIDDPVVNALIQKSLSQRGVSYTYRPEPLTISAAR